MKDPSGVVEIRTAKMETDGLSQKNPSLPTIGIIGGATPAGFGMPNMRRREVEEITIPVSHPLVVRGSFKSFQSPRDIQSEKVFGTVALHENLPSFISVRDEAKLVSASKRTLYFLVVLGTALILVALLVKWDK